MDIEVDDDFKELLDSHKTPDGSIIMSEKFIEEFNMLAFVNKKPREFPVELLEQLSKTISYKLINNEEN